jgi:hypothetical protein
MTDLDNTSRPALGVSRRSAVPQSWVDDFLAEVQRDDLRVDVREQGERLYAGVEWLMETALVVYIARPYLDSMLSELGKDHYKILKGAALKLYNRMGSLQFTRVSTAGKTMLLAYDFELGKIVPVDPLAKIEPH